MARAATNLMQVSKKFGHNTGTASEYEYTVQEREINGKIVKVKVYPSHADKIIKSLHDRDEAVQTPITAAGMFRFLTEHYEGY